MKPANRYVQPNDDGLLCRLTIQTLDGQARTSERPALQRLLAEIKRERVDMVLVYKLDRLSRSLLDFAKLIEMFESHGSHLPP